MLKTAAFEHFHATVSKNCPIFIMQKEKRVHFITKVNIHFLLYVTVRPRSKDKEVVYD